MNINSLKQKINSNEKLKWFIHHCIIIPKKNTPRLWIKLFINPFFSKRGKGSIVKWSAKLNVTPINHFSLGHNSIIECYTVVDNGVGDVTIGHESRIGLSNTIIGPVKVGNNVITAQNVVLSGLNHNYEDVNIEIRKQGVSTAPIEIKDDVWIGANSTITSGVTIGSHSVIAAGSVVLKDIPPYTVSAGTPSRVIKQYDFEQKMWIKVKK